VVPEALVDAAVQQPGVPGSTHPVEVQVKLASDAEKEFDNPSPTESHKSAALWDPQLYEQPHPVSDKVVDATLAREMPWFALVHA
jgi:hypothetical protein